MSATVNAEGVRWCQPDLTPTVFRMSASV